MNLSELWTQLASGLQDAATRLLLAMLALAFIWLIRRIVVRVVVAPMERRAAQSASKWDDIALSAINTPARLLLVAFTFGLLAEILQLDEALDNIVQHLIRSLVMIAIGLAVYRVLDIAAESSTRLLRLTGLDVSERLLPFIKTVTKAVIVALVLVIVVQEWGYDVSGLVAGLGISGLAISLAAQDTIKHLFGFTTIVSDQPFVVGDYIATPDAEGTVEEVGVRSTRLRQPNQSYITVPNAMLANAPVTNWSRLNKRQIDLRLVVDYAADYAQVEILLSRLRQLFGARDQIEHATAEVFFNGFGATGYEISAKAYVLFRDFRAYANEREAVNLEVLRILSETGVKLAGTA